MTGLSRKSTSGLGLALLAVFVGRLLVGPAGVAARHTLSSASVRELAHTTERAMLLSTHDLDLALRTTDRIWLLPRNGPLTTGVPEDLVLSGAFEAAFTTEGVEFEAELGAFRIRSVARGEPGNYTWHVNDAPTVTHTSLGSLLRHIGTA